MPVQILVLCSAPILTAATSGFRRAGPTASPGRPRAAIFSPGRFATGEIDPRMAPFAVDRKHRGKLIDEGAIVVSH